MSYAAAGGATSTTTTLATASLGYYLNLAAKDAAGNWSAGYAFAGPYFIDTIALDRAHVEEKSKTVRELPELERDRLLPLPQTMPSTRPKPAFA